MNMIAENLRDCLARARQHFLKTQVQLKLKKSNKQLLQLTY